MSYMIKNIRENFRLTQNTSILQKETKNKLNTSAIRPLSVGVVCCPQPQRGEKMEEKVNEKVIIISAKDLVNNSRLKSRACKSKQLTLEMDY